APNQTAQTVAHQGDIIIIHEGVIDLRAQRPCQGLDARQFLGKRKPEQRRRIMKKFNLEPGVERFIRPHKFRKTAPGIKRIPSQAMDKEEQFFGHDSPYMIFNEF
ncbi:MAG: hypothetical protein KDC61_24140, partial [Saprospiraceae bacterium]|nr:hypothetical protein [Saprospiraceae bacterium]